MRGRKPIPTEVKKLQGTARKSRILDDELPPVKVDSLPAAPEWLDETAQKEWRIQVEALDRIGVLSKTDLSILAIYCNEVSVYIDAEKTLRSKTRVHLITNNEGKVEGSRVVAYQRIADNALKKMLQIAAEFGFTPSARTRIGLSNKNSSQNNTMSVFKLAK